LNPISNNHNVPGLLLLTRDIPGIGGELKQQEEDFQVREVAAYAPSGTGDHLFLRLTKQGISHGRAMNILAAECRIPRQAIGYAGQKDKQGITSQHISLERRYMENIAAFNYPGMTLTPLGFHGNKLKIGHLKGNRFQLRIRDAHPDAPARLRAKLPLLRAGGLPNFYGCQRFGDHVDNHLQGKNALLAQKRQKKRKNFLINAFQSYLFNLYLGRRMADGLFDRVISGDVLKKRDTGGLFYCQDEDTDQQRLEDGDIVATGPIFGYRMMQAQPPSRDREDALLLAENVTADMFRPFRMRGSRRVLAVSLADMDWSCDGRDVVLSFFLPAGSYATVLCQELMLPRD